MFFVLTVSFRYGETNSKYGPDRAVAVQCEKARVRWSLEPLIWDLGAEVELSRRKFVLSYDSNHKNEMQIQIFGGHTIPNFSLRWLFRTHPRQPVLPILANVSIPLSVPETDS